MIRRLRRAKEYNARHRAGERLVGDGEAGSSGDLQLVALGDRNRVGDDQVDADVNRDSDPNIRRI